MYGKNEIRIAVFGASGATGCEVLKRAIENGIAVNALTRKKSALIKDNLVNEVVGEIRDNLAIAETLKGATAAIIVLGPRAPYTDIFCYDATQRITRECQKTGIKRLICQTGALIGEYPENQASLFRFFGSFFNKKHPLAAADRIGQEEAVKESDLQWTIVKPPRLTAGSRKGRFKQGVNVRCGLLSYISRKDLADCLINLALTDQCSRQAVFVKY